jgi:hypothetical protein
MCPACLSVAAWIVAGAASAGGGGVGLAIRRRRGKDRDVAKGEKDDDAQDHHA